MVKKIDFTKIWSDNIATFKNHDDGSWSLTDFCLFLFFPCLLASLILATDYVLKENFVTAIITAASIFAGLLLNLLVLIYTIVFNDSEKVKVRVGEDRFPIWQNLIQQTFANISFCILVSIIIVSLCLLFYLDAMSFGRSVVIFLLYFFCSSLILHLFMVLKRIHTIIDFEIR